MAEDDVYSRGWIFVWHNYTDNDLDYIKNLKYEYLNFGKETCPNTGTAHLQGYIYYKNEKSFTKVRKEFKFHHVEKAKGNLQQIIIYNSKERDFYEFGTQPRQGKRTDLDNIKNVVLETGKMREVVLHATSYQSIKMAEQILKYHEKKRQWKPIIKWYWGPTGTGKSRTAYEEMPECYTTLSTGKWWDGYDAHEDILIDDMRRDFMKFHELLRLIDRYSFQVETKGGTRQILARRIIITSCYHPTELFDTREDINQLIRRIDEIKKFE